MAITKTSASKKKASSTGSTTTKPKAAFTPIDATKKPTTALADNAPKDGPKRSGKRARTVTKWSKEEVQFVLESIVKYHDKRQNRYKISLFTTIASMFEPKFNIPVEGDQLATIFKSVKKSYNHFIKLTTNPELLYDADKTLIIVPLEIHNSSIKQSLRLLSHLAVKQIEDHFEITFPYFNLMQEILKTNDFTNNNDKENIDNDNDNSDNINGGSEAVEETPVLQHRTVDNGQISVIDGVASSRNDPSSFATISGSNQPFDDVTVAAALQPSLNHHPHHHNQLSLQATAYKDPFSDNVNTLPRAQQLQRTQPVPQHVHLQQHHHHHHINQQQQPVLPPLSASEENEDFRRKVLQLIDLWNIERKTHTDTIASLQNKLDQTNKAVVAIDYKLDKVLEFLKRTSQ